MDNEEFAGETEVDSNLIGSNNDNASACKNKKLLGIIISSILIIIISIIIVVIVLTLISKEDDNSYKVKKAEINCVYDIKQTSEKTKLFGDNYEKRTDFDLCIGEKKIKYTKEYKFDKAERINVKLYIYDYLDMDYMFQNVTDIRSIEMISEKNGKIISMKNSFENCKNLEKLKINF